MNIGAVVFAGFILAVSLVYAGMALDMPRGTLAFPGPGFFPTVIGVFLVATALGCLLQEILPRRKAAKTTPLPTEAAEPAAQAERNVGKTFALIALLIAYGFALKPLGFPLAIFAFVAVAIRIFGYRKWLPTLGMAALIAGISYVTFVIWLKVPLPLGILDAILY